MTVSRRDDVSAAWTCATLTMLNSKPAVMRVFIE
jgi:hypothetical protein